MNSQKRKTKKVKIIAMMIVGLILINQFQPFNAIAAALRLDETGYFYTGISFTNGQKLENKDIWNMKMDGKDVFCIDSAAPANTEDGYSAETYTGEKKDLLSKVAYYGFTQSEQSYKDFATTQLLIWEVLGEQLEWTSLPNYWSDREGILAKVRKHDTQPSWDTQTITLIEGQEFEQADTNSVTDILNITSNATGIQVTKSGNTLKLKADKNAKSGEIMFSKVPDSALGTSILYKKADRQSLVDFYLQDTGKAKLKVNVKKLGGVRVKKIDPQTNKALPNTTIKFEYGNTSKTVVTDANGIAELVGIPEGTQVKISELLAPSGYHNIGEVKTTIIRPSETTELIFNNNKQMGTVKLTKSGQEFGASMPNDNYTLKDALYGIYNSSDERVGELITDEKGYSESNSLSLGQYYLLEEKAPSGYLLSDEKLPFEIKYAGQDVAVTNTEVQAVDVEQKGTAKLIKEDAETGDIAQGKATLDGAVYELYRSSDDKLIDTVTIENGQAQSDDLLLDSYYWLEKEAPTGYLLDKEKHAFDLTYNSEAEIADVTVTVKEQVIKEKIKVMKYDETTKEPIKNNAATFKLKDLQTGEFIEHDGQLEFMTDQSGEFVTEDLPYGEYELIEIIAPTNYQREMEPTKITIDGTHNGIVEVKIMNTEISKPLLKKSTRHTTDPARKATEVKSLPLLGDKDGITLLLIGLALVASSLAIYRSKK
ncbi:TPA: Cys-Gln thioester bond-forming surface protein [Listeria monocytogenes]|nr:Cys-Gln thioester bond-forming surface protein [Listeria monocytogenes]HAO5954068.1 Cys-Gln thioester bond-forming surface protein [Listeria monocytogenes]HAO6038537.1 Cys-Gln thioester bond-forming surface protein [Listeria monocytogenes]HAO6040569.1 Cys-Gln thioester bond-forming surface protein [Listeria monocytogenes]HAO6419165.1 Cys-Gln thioester bond-forming surface protein [Listeria monocytogenes]